MLTRLICALAGLIAFTAVQGQELIENADELNSVYVYGSYVLDMRHRLESVMPARYAEVRDCSDDRYYCLHSVGRSSAVASFTVPKHCIDVKVGQSWGTGDSRTSVMSYLGNADPGDTEDRYLLVNDRHTAAFLYAPADGINALIIGRADVDKALSLPPGRRKELRSVQALLTFDALAPCIERRALRWRGKPKTAI